MRKSEMLQITGISFFLLWGMGIDSPAPQGQRIVMAGMLISAIIAVIGCWLRWIEKGQEESIRRTHEIRRSGKIAAEDSKSTIRAEKTKRSRVHSRDCREEKAGARRVV
jgi:hypothetical protein